MHLLKPCLKRRKREMKKIKHISDIEREKLRLRVLQLEQEKKIRESWKQLREDLKPGNLFREKMESMGTHLPEDKGIVSGLVDAGTQYLTNRLTGYAGKKTDDFIREKMDKLGSGIKKVMQKKKSAD